jgi:hypothetical protein
MPDYITNIIVDVIGKRGLKVTIEGRVWDRSLEVLLTI